MSETAAIVVKGYPRLSETFIAQEIEALERRGLDIVIVSLRRPTDRDVHSIHRRIRAPVLYLPEYVHHEPGRVLRALASRIAQPRFWRALWAWLRAHAARPSRNHARRFAQALVYARERPAKIAWIHAHYIHTPTSVAYFASILTGAPYSISAHAKDIWTTDAAEKRRKLAAARWCVTCTRHAERALAALAPAGRVSLVYHGLDLARFPKPERSVAPEGRPFTLLCVARCVEKKGIDILLRALTTAPGRLIHIGGGPLAGELDALARELDIRDRIEFRGAQPHERVRAAHREADLFVLPARVASDGDRDGLPNVLMEAFALSTPVLASDLPGVAELVTDGETGALVPPENPDALSAAIVRLAADPRTRARLARRARARLEEAFDSERTIEALADRFRAEGLMP